jgi:hypothetical protein
VHNIIRPNDVFSFDRCDADPAALAKYVYALVKKDKTLDELRFGMVEQLDVFLQQGIPIYYFNYINRVIICAKLLCVC